MEKDPELAPLIPPFPDKDDDFFRDEYKNTTQDEQGVENEDYGGRDDEGTDRADADVNQMRDE
eukprot:171216-Hanusia_phi.AAC.2